MAQPAAERPRQKLRLTKLEFCSFVDTPAQQPATFRLIKRANNEGDELQGTWRIAKVGSGENPLVHGWAFQCTDESGAPYQDLQGDVITDDYVTAAEEWFAGGGAVDEMHAGTKTARAAFCYPIDADVISACIGKTAGDATKVSGLMVAVRPTPEQLQKIRDKEWTGFSIAGLGTREPIDKSAPCTTCGGPAVKAASAKCPSCGAYGKADDKGNCPSCGKAMKRARRGSSTPVTVSALKAVLSSLPTDVRDKVQSRAEKLLGARHAKRLFKATQGGESTVVATSESDGHQHTIDLDDPADGWDDKLTTSYNTSAGADNGHSHGWVFDPATGKVEILADSGHTHTVDAVVPAEVIREASLNENGDRCDGCGKSCEPSCQFCPYCGRSMGRVSDGETQVVVIAARAPAAISPPADPNSTVKSITEEQQMADQTDHRIRALEAENVQLKKMASMTDAHRVHVAKLSEQDQINFLNLTPSQRDMVIADALKADEIVYESPYTKSVYRKSERHEIVEAARMADASRKALEQINVRERDLEFTKRADRTLTKFAKGVKGELPMRIMRALDGEFKDPAEHEEAVKALRGANAALEHLEKAIGVSVGDEPAGELPPKAALEKLAADYAKANNVPIYKAHVAVLGTPDGAALYAKLPVGQA